jgi:hypothetical protein
MRKVCLVGVEYSTQLNSQNKMQIVIPAPILGGVVCYDCIAQQFARWVLAEGERERERGRVRDREQDREREREQERVG